MNEYIGFKLSNELNKKLDKEAKSEMRSKGATIRVILEMYFNNKD